MKNGYMNWLKNLHLNYWNDFMQYFEGPDFTRGFFSYAKYRSSNETVKIETKQLSAELPKRIEILSKTGWRQHPVVFYKSNLFNQGECFLIYITEDGAYRMFNQKEFNMKKFYEKAEKFGLTAGESGSSLHE